MTINLAAVAGIVPLTALMLGACVSQSAYDQVQAQNQQLQAQLAQSRAEQKYVEAGDMPFPEGGFQLSQAGQTELANNVAPKLRDLQNAKVVVYGYTDNTPVGAALQRLGVPDNLVLSTRRAADSRNFPGVAGDQPQHHFGQGVWRDPSGNDTPQGRAANRRIEITVQGPGAPAA